VLNDFDGSVPPSQMEFTHSPIWVQVHDMPLLCMNKVVGTKIGQSMGTLEDVDVAGDGVGWGQCLQLRVDMDLQKPLERGRALKLGGKSYSVHFKYEKLPLFCFNCGRILHRNKGCPAKANQRRNSEDGEKRWGVWLRADDYRRKNGGDRGGGYSGNPNHSSEEDWFSEEAPANKERSKKERTVNSGNPNLLSQDAAEGSKKDEDSYLSESIRSLDNSILKAIGEIHSW
jgi:hypothetical protein